MDRTALSVRRWISLHQDGIAMKITARSWSYWPYVASFLHNYPAFTSVSAGLFLLEYPRYTNDNRRV